MRKVFAVSGLTIAIALFGAPLTSTSSFALCNKTCQAKCTLSWQGEFKSEKECQAVWSRRNGPTGRGCGGAGQPFQRCQ